MFVMVPMGMAFSPEQRRAAEIIDRATKRAGMADKELACEMGEHPQQLSAEKRGVGRIDFARLLRIRNPRFLRALVAVLAEETDQLVLPLDPVVDAVVGRLRMARADLDSALATQPTGGAGDARAPRKECA